MKIEDYKKIVKLGSNVAYVHFLSSEIKCMLFGNQEFIDSKWYSSFKNEYCDKPTEGDSITFQKCIDVCFELKEDELFCTMIIWNGDSYDGQREDRRCEFTFKIIKSIEMLDKIFEDQLEYIAIRKIEREDEIKMNKRIKDKMKSLLA